MGMKNITELKDRLSEVLLELSKYKSDRVSRYRLVAESEDIDDGHWDGKRMDLPPENWEG